MRQSAGIRPCALCLLEALDRTLRGTTRSEFPSRVAPALGEGDHVGGKESEPPFAQADSSEEALPPELVDRLTREPKEVGSLVSRPQPSLGT